MDSKASALFRLYSDTSYQTAPLADYSPALQARAAALFERVCTRLGPSRAVTPDGSYSALARDGSTAAKILIYEAGKGKVNGIDPALEDGVYIMIRLTGPGRVRGKTLAVAPWHEKPFAYFRLTVDQDIEEIADFIAACADGR